jgi:hypothetical protein
MAGERKENSVLFSLKELKDITADEPEQPVRQKAAPAPPSASTRRQSFIDDKDDLLADLRSSVAADAEAEAARIEAERRAQREAEERRKHETATLQRAEIDARIAAEQARRRAAEDERVARARQIDIDERRARGEIIEEPVAAPEPVVHVTHAPAPMAPQVLAPVQPQGRSTAFYLTVVGLPVVCITAIAIAVIVTQKETTLQPVSNEPVVVNVQQPAAVITASPTAPAIASAPATEPPAPASEVVAESGKPKPRPRPKPGGGEKPAAGADKPAKPAGGGIKIDLNSD